MYKNKYLKYKNKYLQLKKIQKGGEPFCNRVYQNILGTCWAVAIQTIFTFGDFTSVHLKAVMTSFNLQTKNDFIEEKIRQVKSNPQLNDLFPGDILNVTKHDFLRNIFLKFIDRYYSKVLEIKNPDAPRIDPKLNKERCELVIIDNFKKLFDNPILQLTSKDLGGSIISRYLFFNLLSIFFLGFKVSFKKYYDKFNLIEFDRDKDLGILIHIERHTCCLYICEGQQKYYNDNDKKVYNCEWIDLLKRTNNLYVETDVNLRFVDFDSYENKDKLKKVKYLTVVSKHERVNQLDIEIKKILNLNYSEITDSELQFMLAHLFFNIGNYNEVLRWYTLAAQQGHAEAQFNLGIMFENDQYVGKDLVEAERWYRIAAGNGHDGAQNNLGNMLFDGRGVAKNIEEAAHWYFMAAERGNVASQNMYADLLWNGIGIDEDKGKALHYYRLAAEQGNRNSLFRLGVMFEDGTEADDKTEAVRLYRFAAEKGHADAQFRLGNMLLNGIGVASNTSEALEWYRRAAEQKHAQAQSRLGYNYEHGIGVDQDPEEAVRLYRLAADQGYTEAQINLGVMFTNGLGVAQDHAEAVRLYRLAAAQGHADAQYNLGVMFTNGLGVAQDQAEAVRLWHLAAAQGHADAQNALTIIEESL